MPYRAEKKWQKKRELTYTLHQNLGRLQSLTEKRRQVKYIAKTYRTHNLQILTVDLRLPNRVSHTPQSCQGVEHDWLLWIGRPHKEGDHDSNVDDGTQEEDGHPPDQFDDVAKGKGADCIADTVGNQDVANVLDSIRTGDKTLKTDLNIHSSLCYTLKNDWRWMFGYPE